MLAEYYHWPSVVGDARSVFVRYAGLCLFARSSVPLLSEVFSSRSSGGISGASICGGLFDASGDLIYSGIYALTVRVAVANCVLPAS